MENAIEGGRERRFLPQDGYSRWETLKDFVPLGREAIRLREKAGKFPRRVRFGTRCSAWDNREIHRWLADPEGYRSNGDGK
jgi:predicted DNA-binding transcriptional regulator AlpA